jgi:hypothetical protein
VLPNVEIRVVTLPKASTGFIPYARVIHSKTMTIDGKLAWVGTSNWSGGYFDLSRNLEIVLRNEQMARVSPPYMNRSGLRNMPKRWTSPSNIRNLRRVKNEKTGLCTGAGGRLRLLQRLAWGNDGHRAVGAIADKLLKGSNAEKQVQGAAAAGRKPGIGRQLGRLREGQLLRPADAGDGRLRGANPKHSEYHYTDVPFQLITTMTARRHGGRRHRADPEAGIAVLQGKDTPADQPAQVHQAPGAAPPHPHDRRHPPAAARGRGFVSKDGQFVVPKTHAEIDSLNIFDSRGGNNLLMDDNKLSTRTPDQFAQWAIDTKPNIPVNKGDVTTWPVQWANDALIVSKQAHADVKVGAASKQTSRSSGESYTVWALSVPDNYPVPSSAIAREQLIKGGYHLAAMLQKIWP